jgi:hypothetical protein
MKKLLPFLVVFAVATTAFAAKPKITAAPTATGQVGVPFSFQITAINDATGYNAAGLPPGLSLDRATGLISGTPAANGTSTVTASANNTAGGGLRARVTFSIAQ